MVKFLSIPFIGIFALHRNFNKPFQTACRINFQFPLLGFLLCIANLGSGSALGVKALSIPFIGIFALHRLPASACLFPAGLLSIPFIGIFALHLWLKRPRQRPGGGFFQFPLLGFLLCICWWLASRRLGSTGLSIPFIGIFALHRRSKNCVWTIALCLSIPFIGIFALHRRSCL